MKGRTYLAMRDKPSRVMILMRRKLKVVQTFLGGSELNERKRERFATST